MPVSRVLMIRSPVLRERLQGRAHEEAAFVADLDTKYYTAGLACHHAHVVLHDPAALAAVQHADALVLCFDPTQESEVATLASATSALEQLMERLQPALALCVAHSEQWTEANAATWAGSGARRMQLERCIELGLELVDSSAVSQVTGDLGPEKEGLDRIVEALHSTLWPRHTRKGPAAAAPGRALPAVPPPAVAAAPAPAPAAAEKAPAAAQPPAEAPKASAPLNKISTADLAKSAEEDDDADPDSEMLKMMQEFAQLRNRARALPDEERRALAAETALRFARMLQLEDGDEDDEAPAKQP